METLPSRTQRLSTQTSATRLFCLCSIVGLVSLVGVCVVVLPWHVLFTQGQWVAFAFIAIVSFCWLGSIAAVGQLQLDLERTVKSLTWMLTLLSLAQVALGLFLEHQLVTRKTEFVENCTSLETAYTERTCTSRIGSITIAFACVVFLLPVLSIPLLYLLFRHISHLSPSHLYSNLDNPEDLPPNWHVRPETFAPDSSASDDDDDGSNNKDKGKRSHARDGSLKPVERTGDAWFELGKRDRDSAAESGKRWSDIRRYRDRKGAGRA
ncbi:hypothetical protein JCM3766R1_003632 [Sporobolomyces carnicolor]